MTEKPTIRPRLRQVWPPVGPEDHPRLGYRRDEKLRKAKDLLAWRSMRTEVLGSTLLHDPAWELLLHIYAGELANCAVTPPELAAALQTSVASVERWLRALHGEGLVDQSSHSETSSPVRLTDHGIGGMHALFELLPCRGSPGALSA
jgi:DNA-binding MarR family transcriptional regulator